MNREQLVTVFSLPELSHQRKPAAPRFMINKRKNTLTQCGGNQQDCLMQNGDGIGAFFFVSVQKWIGPQQGNLWRMPEHKELCVSFVLAFSSSLAAIDCQVQVGEFGRHLSVPLQPFFSSHLQHCTGTEIWRGNTILKKKKKSLCGSLSSLVQSNENVTRPHSCLAAKALWRCVFQTCFSVLLSSQQKTGLLWNECKLINNRFTLVRYLLLGHRSNSMAIRSLRMKISSCYSWEMDCSPSPHSWIPLFSWVNLYSLTVVCHNLMLAAWQFPRKLTGCTC